MVNLKVVEYVRESRGKGKSDIQIADDLRGIGASEADIQSGLAEARSQANSAPLITDTIHRQPSTSNLNIWLPLLVLGCSLIAIVVVAAVIALVIDYGSTQTAIQEYSPQPTANPRYNSPSAANLINIDFGPTGPSEKTGPAVVGSPGDYWNHVAKPGSGDHTITGLKYSGGGISPAAARLVNLGGSWGSGGVMGVDDRMLDSYNYPFNNQGGNSQVQLSFIPPGTYDLYVYGHGASPTYYGDYTVTVGGKNYGRKRTSDKSDAIDNVNWVEGSQYVVFPGVNIGSTSDTLEILIRPGGYVVDGMGRGFSDSMICGLQLVPA